MKVDLQALYLARCQVGSDISEHLPLLYQLVLEMDAQQVIELGVRGGESTAAFLAALEETGGKLWSCDVDLPNEVTGIGGPAVALLGQVPHWTFVLGDDLQLVDHAPSECDVLFIDTIHEFDQVLAELRAYGGKVQPGGAIVLHDIEDGAAENSVVQAISAYRQGREEELQLQLFTNCHGLGVITVC